MATTPRCCRDFAALEGRRFKAAQLFADGESQAAVARALRVTTAAVNYWYHAWRAKGRTSLKAAGRVGRKSRLAPAQLGKVNHALRTGPHAHRFSTDLWTLPRVVEVIERLTGVANYRS